jgi:DNA-binding transcriptional ArsR family regulator
MLHYKSTDYTECASIALAERSRRALLENLRNGQKAVTELLCATQLKQPNVSNHRAKMRMQGIVRAERIGRQVYYPVAMPFADVLLRMYKYASSPEASAITTKSLTLYVHHNRRGP